MSSFKLFLFFCSILFWHDIAAQWIINCRITSEEGNPIRQAEVFFPDYNKLLISDDFGFFSFKINDTIDSLKIIISHVAYQNKEFVILKKDISQEIKLVLKGSKISLEKIKIYETFDKPQNLDHITYYRICELYEASIQ